MSVLAEIGPRELLHFPDIDISDEVLRTQGFLGV